MEVMSNGCVRHKHYYHFCDDCVETRNSKWMEVMKEREIDQLWIEVARLKLNLLKITDRIKEHKIAKEAETQSDKGE